MVGPERKRQAVCHMRRALEVSERRACATIEQPRSTHRYEGIKQEKAPCWPQSCAASYVRGPVQVTEWQQHCCGEEGCW